LKVLRSVADVRAWRAGAGRVGFVPTMGALHAGHTSLVERAVRESDAAVVSIFVNPTQFGPNEDFTAYPRTEAEDVALLEDHGCAVAFIPPPSEIYAQGDATRVTPGPIAAPLEGAARPGHFIGVATVVAKLLAIVRPDTAFFGQKDFQQLRVLQMTARDLRLGADIVGCPTVREPDGLALSSRNAYLSPEERAAAVVLPRALATRDPERARALLNGLEVDYVEVADFDPPVLAAAVRVGNTRLIDNVVLEEGVGT
jgi:pantoate--beta-alanine ligase